MTTNDNVQPESEPAAPTARRTFAPGAKVAAPIVAALLVGAGAAFAVDHHSSTATASAGGISSAAASAQDQNQRGLGGVAGEQRIQGTVAAKSGSTITVKSSGGTTASYTVDSATQIVRNGQSASLSDVAVGDPVFVHVYPSSSGQMLVERLFAGSSATDGGGPGFGPPPSGSGSGTPSTGTATHI
jgi:hypothetical protein